MIAIYIFYNRMLYHGIITENDYTINGRQKDEFPLITRIF